MSEQKVPIAVARGDGIGPEIMQAVLDILEAAGARIDLHEVTVGEAAYAAGETNGISDADFKKLEACRAMLKAPLGTPQGKGYGSVNVAIRKRFDLFANVRPYLSLEPVVLPKSGKTDMVIVRENLEDLYAGIEHRPTPDTVIGRKVITMSESERIIRAAFEYARANGRKTVTGISKDNIQKFTDGIFFHQVLDEVAKDYPDIEHEFYIADIGIARLGARPQDFDVVVTQNMYGDISSDVVGEAMGSIGLNGSANIGEKFAMFEAVHGTAPLMAGKNTANPSGLLMAAVMMLNYIGQNDVAEKIQNAWLKTIEDGIHTKDIYREDDSSLLEQFKGLLTGKKNYSTQKAGTKEMAQAVIARLGQKPRILKPVDYSSAAGGFSMPESGTEKDIGTFFTTGADVHVEHDGTAKELADKVQPLLKSGIKLQEIQTARGDTVWPGEISAFDTDYMTLRLVFEEARMRVDDGKKLQLLEVLDSFTKAANIKWQEVRMLTQNARTQENNYR